MRTTNTKAPATAMILAAGRGSRLAELTATTPKPLVEVGQTPVLFTHLDRLAQFGVARVVINISYLALKIFHAVNQAQQAGRWPALEIVFSWEEERLETGGGLKNAAQLLGHTPQVLVLNADSIWPATDLSPMELVCAAHNPCRFDATLALVPCRNTHNLRPNGDFNADAAGTLKFANMQDKSALCYMGVHICNLDPVLNWPANCFSLVEPWRHSAQQGRLHGTTYHGQWVDMGTPQGLALAPAVLNLQNSTAAAA